VNFGRRRAVAASTQPARPRIARMIRWLAPVIILAWTALILVLNLAVPSLEQVGRERGLTASSRDAPAMQAITRMGKVFEESDSDNFATVVLEGQEPLADDVRAYYDGLIRNSRTTRNTSSMCRIYGETGSRRGARKAPTARLFTCS